MAAEPSPLKPPVPGAGDGRDRRRGDVQVANAVVVRFRNQHVPGGVDGQAARKVQHRRCGGAVCESGLTAARDGRDDTVRVDAPDAMIGLIADVDVPGRIRDGVSRKEEAGRGRRSAIAGEAFAADTGDGLDDPGLPVDTADAVLAGFGDVDAAVRPDADVIGLVERCDVGREPVAVSSTSDGVDRCGQVRVTGQRARGRMPRAADTTTGASPRASSMPSELTKGSS